MCGELHVRGCLHVRGAVLAGVLKGKEPFLTSTRALHFTQLLWAYVCTAQLHPRWVSTAGSWSVTSPLNPRSYSQY